MGGGREEDAIKCSDQFPVSYIEVHNPCGPGGQHQAHITNPKRQGGTGLGCMGKKKLPVKALCPSLLTVLEGGLAPLQFKLQLVHLL